MKITANGLTLHCEVEGPSEAPAVVFVHGLAASSAVWKGQSDRFTSAFRVVRYDLRAHGFSESRGAPCSRSDLVDDLCGVMDACGVDRAFVVGHSAGGVVAMQTALERADRVRGLVLVGTASECNDKTAAWYAQAAETARSEGGAAALRVMGVRDRDAPVPDGAGFAHLAMAMRTLNQEPLTASLRSLALPTLVVVGERDFLGVGGSVILHRAIAGSELEIVPGRGHGIYIEDPDWFHRRVAEFFERVTGTQRG